MRKQKSNKLDMMITEKDDIIDKELFDKYFDQFGSLSDSKKICVKQGMHKKMKN